MNKIKMKINGYDEQSYSLLVSFASDKTKSQDPSDYQAYAYQPMSMWPDISDLEEIKKRMAQAGLYLVEQQRIKEQFIADENRIQSLKSMVGKTFEYNVEEVTSTPVITSKFSNEIDT
jgi:hypothetical protein